MVCRFRYGELDFGFGRCGGMYGCGGAAGHNPKKSKANAVSSKDAERQRSKNCAA